MTLDDLTVDFRHLDRRSLLQEWEWLIGSTKLPILLTASGDAFVQDVEDGSVYVLDTGDGSIHRVASSVENFQSLLGKRDFVANYFAVQMVGDLVAGGQHLSPGQIYSYKQPLVLGGECVLDNIERTDIAIHFSIAGQIHRQVAGLPAGTHVAGASIT
jgi:hypothetical protein